MRLQSIIACIIVQLLLANALGFQVPHPEEPSPPVSPDDPVYPEGEGGTSSTGEGCLGTTCEGGGTSGHTGSSGTTGYQVPGSASKGSEIDGEEVSDVLEEVAEQIISIVSGLVISSSTASASSAPFITAAPTYTDSNAQGCVSAHSIFSSCSARTSGLLSAENTVRASCLCYQTSGVSPYWTPDFYDNAISSCNKFLATMTQPYTVTTAIAGELGLCSTLGDVREVSVPTSSVPASTVSFAPVSSSGTACRIINSVSLLAAFGIALSGIAL